MCPAVSRSPCHRTLVSAVDLDLLRLATYLIPVKLTSASSLRWDEFVGVSDITDTGKSHSTPSALYLYMLFASGYPWKQQGCTPKYVSRAMSGGGEAGLALASCCVEFYAERLC